MQDPDPRCSFFLAFHGIKWHFMAFYDILWHFGIFAKKSNKKSNPIFPVLSDFFRLLDFSRLLDFQIPQLQKVPLFNCSKLSAFTKLLPALSSTTTSTSILTIFISQRRINQVSKASVYRESVNQLLTRPGLDPDLIKKRIDWRQWEWHNKNSRCVRRKCQIFFSGLTHIRLQEWSH